MSDPTGRPWRPNWPRRAPPRRVDVALLQEPSRDRATLLSLRVPDVSAMEAASQMRAVLSDDAVTMRDPSGLKAAEVTQ